MRALREQIEELDGNEVYGRVVGVRGLMVEVAGPLHTMSVGARGVVFGRHVITHERPDRMVAALGEIVHGGATVDQAAKQLNPPR